MVPPEDGHLLAPPVSDVRVHSVDAVNQPEPLCSPGIPVTSCEEICSGQSVPSTRVDHLYKHLVVVI